MIDAHCHLQNSPDIQEDIKGLDKVICAGYNLESSKKALEIAEKYDGVFATVGVHPEESQNSNIKGQNFKSKLLNLLKHQKTVAVGECGLDYTPQTSEGEKRGQRELLKFNLELARETKLPLVIHCRNAFEDIFSILNAQYSMLNVQMHCFTGNMEQMQECVRRGWYMSFGGIITFKSSHELREVAKQVPPDRLLIETDSPYISPEPFRGQRNSPANSIYIAKVIAKARGIDLAELDKITTANVYRLFPKLKLPSF